MKITTIHSPWMNSLMLHPNLMIQLLILMMSTTECLNTSIMMICALYSTFLITLTFYMWSRYPKVKGIFGVTLPSSAPVERFFSTVGHIEVLRRNCFSDSTFEQLLLLKALLSSWTSAGCHDMLDLDKHLLRIRYLVSRYFFVCISVFIFHSF